MQAFPLTEESPVYTPPMQTGRPAKRERTPFGQRLHTLREQAGLSQEQLGAKLGLSQRVYAYWERHPVALRPDQLLSLAEALNVSVEDLVGTNGKKKRGSGPTGKMRQLFEAASRLPRNQQQKIAAIIEPFIAHHAQR
ncbi:MAG: helix-turn-helix domain-containing protein [Pyrinomonadaceae bacterium]